MSKNVDANQELIGMLKYFEKTNENTENISNSSKIKLLEEKVKLIKSNDKVGVKLMNSWEKEIFDLTGLSEKEIREL